MGADDLRLDGAERRIGQSQLARLIAAQVVEDGIRRADQSVQDCLPVGLAQIKAQAFLTQIERLEKVAVVLAQKMRP